MTRSSLTLRSLLATVGLALAASTAQAQHLVVSHDEWVTDNGFFGTNEKLFMSNALTWFGAGAGSQALIYSNSAMLNNVAFSGYLTGKGIASTVNANAASFAPYKVVFVEANQLLNAAGLTSYIQSGGNVVLFGGTGVPNAPGEAAYSNPFLNNFGFNFASQYNGLGTTNTAPFGATGPFGSALFTGVSSIYANSGNTISLTAPVANVTSQLFQDDAGRGVFGAAVYQGATTVAPEPATLALVAFGMIVAVPLARRRRR
ncbi:MAG: hypothetical protein ABJB74_10055 [Gemmatimonas sp.]